MFSAWVTIYRESKIILYAQFNKCILETKIILHVMLHHLYNLKSLYFYLAAFGFSS